ncbi:hypothetical protein FISHEDRAFT_74023 [Fistulina hepatica ATCC 64428]|uniref:Uncharacterized protein n=1 Tax=Fistulina hepatica ATCC 64428 TaxID=1128425 RepID=A0A0D7ABI4_9AGAR|nr:hypothetical protein FISHEDRAFT_74023 [Fistulina hepatica ATCC 64428]
MGHFVGVDDKSKGIRVWYPGTRCIIVERDFYWSQDATETVQIEGETVNNNVNAKTNQHNTPASDVMNTHPAAPNTTLPSSPVKQRHQLQGRRRQLQTLRRAKPTKPPLDDAGAGGTRDRGQASEAACEFDAQGSLYALPARGSMRRTVEGRRSRLRMELKAVTGCGRADGI